MEFFKKRTSSGVRRFLGTFESPPPPHKEVQMRRPLLLWITTAQCILHKVPYTAEKAHAPRTRYPRPAVPVTVPVVT